MNAPLPPPRKAGYQPTLSDVSQQITALSIEQAALHGEVRLLRKDVSTLTGHVLGDHGPRIQTVEHKTGGRVVQVGKYVGVAAIFPLLEQLIPVIQSLLEK